jgi:hypothetical protein
MRLASDYAVIGRYIEMLSPTGYNKEKISPVHHNRDLPALQLERKRRAGQRRR